MATRTNFSLVLLFCCYFFMICNTLLAQPNQTLSTGKIYGKTIDDADRPIETEIRAYSIEADNGKTRLITQCVTHTNVLGLYSCKNLESGRYLIAAFPKLANSCSDKDCTDIFKNTLSLTFYPSTPDLDQASETELQAGASEISNIKVCRSDLHTISGTVSAKPELALLAISLHSEKYVLPLVVSLGYNPKTFQWSARNLPPGRYNIEANWFGAGVTHHGSLEADARTIASPLSIDEDSSVTGHLQIPEGGFANAADLVVLESTTSPGVLLKGKLDDLGNFKLLTVPNGRYFIRLESSHFYISEVKANGDKLPTKQVSLKSGSNISLSIQVKYDVASLAGRIETGARGIVVIENKDDFELTALQTDDFGKFQSAGLQPGAYWLYAWSSPDHLQYRDVHVLETFRNERRSIDLHEGSQNLLEDLAVFRRPY